MNPDVLITIVLASFVGALAIPAAVLMVRIARSERRADADPDVAASAKGPAPCTVVTVRGTTPSNSRKGVS
jgi:hypothetical protein